MKGSRLILPWQEGLAVALVFYSVASYLFKCSYGKGWVNLKHIEKTPVRFFASGCSLIFGNGLR